ncbi:hypothetical protein PHISP_07866 [Aspergillus sp. HF37]|nr:hypothetical protein PHISP_07866 [Aspergillus sp. HF37]
MQSTMNRTLTVRPRRDPGPPPRTRLNLATFRSMQGPEMSRKMNRLIKMENNAISATESVGRERVSVAAQLSEWGEATEDDTISDISDKLGVLMAEIGDQEDIFAQSLEDYRTALKHIRNMESSVQPSRDQRFRITDEIQRLKYREPTSPKLGTLEQELVRAEATNLVAEAQLTNLTRQKIKESFDIHLAAVIERSEKQTILARHARRLLHFVDDTPIIPGDQRRAYKHADDARNVLDDAENDLRSWVKSVEPIPSSAGNRDVSATNVVRSSAKNARDSLAAGQEEQEADGAGAEGEKEEAQASGAVLAS